MAAVKLEYGRCRRVDVRRLAKRAAFTAAVVLAVGGTAWYAVWRVQRLERDRLTPYFEAMPGVASVYVDDYSEGIDEYWITGVAVRLNEPPGAFIWFDASSVRSLRDDGEIQIGGIGGLQFEQTRQLAPNGWAGYNSIGIGPAGEFAPLIPLKINSAADVIANYDELLAALAALPPTGVATHPDGNTFTYEITGRRSNVKSMTAPSSPAPAGRTTE